MPVLTRRKINDPQPTGWRVFYGDVCVGVIARRTGCPVDVDQWEWGCGFYPGLEAGQHRSGSAATFDQARADFEQASNSATALGNRPAPTLLSAA
jgi:hypothetical protein